MRRLYVQIYLAFVGIALLFGLLAATARYLQHEEDRGPPYFEGLGELISEVLPGPQQPRDELESALNRYREKLGWDFTVVDDSGVVLASAGPPMQLKRSEDFHSGWSRLRSGGFGLAVELGDGRLLLAKRPYERRLRWLVPLIIFFVAISIGAWPLARRITRRLERLRSQVEALGAGQLSARVEVEGKDEVADLARSFNRAAGRIESLIEAQRSMLAGASHELRSPLSRIRMAVELLETESRPELVERIRRDIADLDELIEELLFASRMQAQQDMEATSEVDVLAIAVEEGARVDASVGGDTLTVRGNERWLRRMMRNLFDNAARYGQGAPISGEVKPSGTDAVCIVVEDAGPGIPENERERVFEPFYQRQTPGADGHEGVGLGLALVRQIAERHGGGARCLARTEGGTRFEITLKR